MIRWYCYYLRKYQTFVYGGIGYCDDIGPENRLTTNNVRRIEFVTSTRVFDEIISTKSKILDCGAGILYIL